MLYKFKNKPISYYVFLLLLQINLINLYYLLLIIIKKFFEKIGGVKYISIHINTYTYIININFNNIFYEK